MSRKSKLPQIPLLDWVRLVVAGINLTYILFRLTELLIQHPELVHMVFPC